jgi:hypothetical protein
MADEIPETESPDPSDAPSADDRDAAAAVKPKRARRRWKWPLILLAVFVGLPAVAFALWSWVALSWTYSEGDRAGYVQKFSHKGWICKTWEGELSMVNIPGAAQERWMFSVRSDSIAEVIKQHMGNRVSLTYEEKRGLPTSCFGETNHFVTGVRRVP